MKISDTFNVISGLSITMSEIYLNPGNFPYVSAQTEGEGITCYCDEEWLKQNKNSMIIRVPCITWTKNGFYAGTLFYRDYPFYLGGDCGVLLLKEMYNNKINLKWFVYAMKDYFKQYVTSKSGQGKLSGGVMMQIELPNIPTIEEQNKFVENYESIKRLEKKFERISDELLIVRKMFSLTYDTRKGSNKLISELFNIGGGNGQLTEIYRYSNKLIFDGDSVNIYSASSNEPDKISSDVLRLDDRLKIYHGPAIVVSRNGNAGIMKYVKDDTFLITDHAYVITCKGTSSDVILLDWFFIVGSEILQKCVTSIDSNGTFSKNIFLKQIISVPPIKEQKETIQVFNKFLLNESRIQRIRNVIS